jgi:hypothetical protein
MAKKITLVLNAQLNKMDGNYWVIGWIYRGHSVKYAGTNVAYKGSFDNREEARIFARDFMKKTFPLHSTGGWLNSADTGGKKGRFSISNSVWRV